MKEKTKPIVGIYEDMPFEEYQAIDAINSGMVRDAMKSLRYMRRRELEPKPEYNYIYEVGKAFAYICEGMKTFYDHVEVGPTKTAGTIKWMAELEENPGKVLVTENDYVLIQAMREACVSNVDASPLFDRSQPVQRELTFVWECERTGAMMKGRADFVLDDWLVDAKTINSVYKSRWHIRDFRYDVQLTMYADGLRHNGVNINRVSNLFIEKEQILPEVVVKDYGLDETGPAYDDLIMTVQMIQSARKSGEYAGWTYPKYEQDTLTSFSE